MLKISIGHTEEIDSEEAALKILEQCKAEFAHQKAQAGILYAPIDHEFDVLLKKINEEHPEIELIGCTTDGELSSVMGFAEDSVTLILFASDEIDMKAGVADGISQNLEQNISESLEKIRSRFDKELKLCILNPVSITSSGAVILESFKQVLGTYKLIGNLIKCEEQDFIRVKGINRDIKTYWVTEDLVVEAS